jgi:hypothetical protein
MRDFANRAAYDTRFELDAKGRYVIVIIDQSAGKTITVTNDIERVIGDFLAREIEVRDGVFAGFKPLRARTLEEALRT